jgi:SpoVK/Ycf46/Vps4 family AAA+-type ATPase
MALCVLFADEMEKALARATSSGQTDSGVTARVFGSLLTWLNDHESDIFFVGTCNDASKLPPEFARADRFDGVFLVDSPRREQKGAVWGIYQNVHGLDAKQALAGRHQLDRSRDQVVLQSGVALGRAARSGPAQRRARGCHCRRHDREPAAVGLGSVPRSRPSTLKR